MESVTFYNKNNNVQYQLRKYKESYIVRFYIVVNEKRKFQYSRKMEKIDEIILKKFPEFLKNKAKNQRVKSGYHI